MRVRLLGLSSRACFVCSGGNEYPTSPCYFSKILIGTIGKVVGENSEIRVSIGSGWLGINMF